MSFIRRILRSHASDHDLGHLSFDTTEHYALVSPEMSAIQAGRSRIHAEFERTARLGFVPAEALIGRLYASHCDELAQDKRQLDVLQQSLEAHLRRLDSLFPAPVPPSPEPPVPPRQRTFRRLSDTWSQPNPRTHH